MQQFGYGGIKTGVQLNSSDDEDMKPINTKGKSVNFGRHQTF